MNRRFFATGVVVGWFSVGCAAEENANGAATTTAAAPCPPGEVPVRGSRWVDGCFVGEPEIVGCISSLSTSQLQCGRTGDALFLVPALPRTLQACDEGMFRALVASSRCDAGPCSGGDVPLPTVCPREEVCQLQMCRSTSAPNTCVPALCAADTPSGCPAGFACRSSPIPNAYPWVNLDGKCEVTFPVSGSNFRCYPE